MKRFFPYLLFFSFLATVQAQKVGCTTGDCTNGKGRYLHENGDKYIGEFKNGLREGRGVYYYHSGNVYKGQYKNNLRHGYGTYEWSNGDVYVGDYYMDQRQGEGIYYPVGGEPISGFWKDGELVEAKGVDIAETNENTDGKVDPFGGFSEEKKYSGEVFRALAGEIADQPRTALVMGNSTYEKSPLKNPANDALAMAQELQRSGFEVLIFTDATQKEMKKAIRSFGQLLKERGGVGLFFYAGHGLQADGRNYIVPVDADISKIEDVEFESVDLGRILVEMDYADNDMNIVILDACRDNPYEEDFRSSGRSQGNGLAAIGSAPYNSLVAFSTSPGSVAFDGDGVNGLYTQELLKAMRIKGIKIEEVFKKVRSNVRKQSEGTQMPWENSSIEDDFYFKK